jgi:hypothetical protein
VHLFLDLCTQLSESILNHALDLVGSMWVLIKISRDIDLVLPDDGLSSEAQEVVMISWGVCHSCHKT